MTKKKTTYNLINDTTLANMYRNTTTIHMQPKFAIQFNSVHIAHSVLLGYPSEYGWIKDLKHLIWTMNINCRLFGSAASLQLTAIKCTSPFLLQMNSYQFTFA